LVCPPALRVWELEHRIGDWVG